jgi:hypothetical protein
MPVGAMLLLGYSFYASSKRGDAIFEHNPGSSFQGVLPNVVKIISTGRRWKKALHKHYQVFVY